VCFGFFHSRSKCISLFFLFHIIACNSSFVFCLQCQIFTPIKSVGRTGVGLLNTFTVGCFWTYYVLKIVLIRPATFKRLDTLAATHFSLLYDTVPCACYFSFEAYIYVRGILDMRVLPVSYPHPFLPPSLPWVALRNSRPLLCGTLPGKHLLEILFGLPFSKFCFGPGRSTRSLWSADVTSTRYRKFVFACVFAGGCTCL
jgi:hypothetical protein